uniref:Uncharacterized protein n=1 Tax=Arcella intermedia TaxID=1963864 RepID=A0A6B2LX83_9EUKA
MRGDVGIVEGLGLKQRVAVWFGQGVEMAEKVGAVRYMECSALTQRGLREVFGEAARAGWVAPHQPPHHIGRCLLL